MRIETDVLTLLSNSDTEGNLLRLPEQVDRNLYMRTNKVLAAAGGQWKSGKVKAHVFDGDAAEAMEQILLTGQVTIPQNFGYFPTPDPVIQQMLALASLCPGMNVLEPSAGRGAIAEKLKPFGVKISCIELLPENCMCLNRDGFDSLQADFLTVEQRPIFDRVIMNPPFAKRADIHHVRHALGFLKSDGLLVSVMSSGVTFRDDLMARAFRDLIDDRGGEIIPLPEGSFKESGTNVNTVLVTIPGFTYDA